MSIQKKLILSFGAMIVVPIVLFSIAVYVMFHVFAEGESLTNTGNELERIAERDTLFAELKLLTTADPDKLLDLGFLTEMGSRLNEWDYGLLIRVDDEVVYAAEGLRDIPVSEQLPAFGQFANQVHESVEINGIPYKFRQHDYYLPTWEKGSIFLIEEASSLEQFAFDYLPMILLMLVLILVLTNGILSYLVSRSFINPMKMLQRSTERIKSGDLAFELSSNRRDEIGELISDFEDMRGKLKESIEKQLQYENDRKLLLSNISHDLKTPIASIRGYVEGIKDGIANTDEKRNKYIDIISKRANEMDTMIDELFYVSTLDLKQVPFHFERVNLTSYLRETVDEFGWDFQKRGIKLELLMESGTDIHVRADREKLTRVFNNILQNSAKYMDKADGVIKIGVVQNGEQALITITDNGPGIPAHAIPHIFDTFYRAESSRNKKTGGTGLGLTIAKQIIEAHGGSIRAESEAGEGTSIYVTLPVMEQE